MDNHSLTKKELSALLFWATDGLRKAEGGSYEKEVVDTIVKFTKILKWKQDNFCLIGYKAKRLARILIERLNKENRLRIKIS